MDDLRKIAMLIDADNSSVGKIEAVITEIGKKGRIVVKRAYGNWKKDTLRSWEPEIKRLGISTAQQFDYVAGKNATDMALTIDAMDMLYRELYDAFVIVASDSDYTPLAIRLRESGLYVIGVGVMNTPPSFTNACDEFLYIETIAKEETKEKVEVKEAKPKSKKKAKAKASKAEDDTDSKKDDKKETKKKVSKSKDVVAETEEVVEKPAKKTKKKKTAEVPSEPVVEDKPSHDLNEIHQLVRDFFEQDTKNEEYVNVARVSTYIRSVKPEFNIKDYGYKKVSDLFVAFPDIYEMAPKKEANITRFKLI